MSTQLDTWQEQNKLPASRGLDESTWSALKSTIYPGAKDESIILAVDYCRSRKLDPMLKPVHLVPMQVKVQKQGKKPFYEWRDVPMPGISLYRIQASRSKDFGGMDEPEFGPEVIREFTYLADGDDRRPPEKKTVQVTYPQWCRVTVYRIVNGERCPFTAREYWTENYATAGRDSDLPNAMWRKRPYGQLAKCAEAQALRKAWPEVCTDLTAEEMMGKALDVEDLRDVSPAPAPENPTPAARKPATQEPAEDAEFTECPPAAGQPEAAGVTAGDTELIKPNHVRMITSKLERFSKDDKELLSLLGVDSLQAIPLSRLNDAMDYVNALGKKDGGK